MNDAARLPPGQPVVFPPPSGLAAPPNQLEERRDEPEEPRRRAGLFTMTVALVGLGCAVVGRGAFGDRLNFSDDLVAASVLDAYHAFGIIGVVIALVAGRWVRGDAIAYICCALVGLAMVVFAIEWADADSLPAALVPGAAASFGCGGLVPAALLATRRRWLAWIGAALVVAFCAFQIYLARDLPVWPRDVPEWSSDFYPSAQPDATEPVQTDRFALTLFGAVALFAGVGGTVDVFRAWSAVRRTPRPVETVVGLPERPVSAWRPGAEDGDDLDLVEGGAWRPTRMTGRSAALGFGPGEDHR